MRTLRQYLTLEIEQFKPWCQAKYYRPHPLAELLRAIAHAADDAPLMQFFQETVDEGDSDPRWSPLFDKEQWPPLEKGALLEKAKKASAFRKLKELKELICMLQNFPKGDKE